MAELEPIFFKNVSASKPFEITKIKNQPKGSSALCLKRWGHTAAIFENNLYIYGGELKASQNQQTNFVFKICLEDLENNYWQKLLPKDSETTPIDRDSHSAVICNKKWYILFGHFHGNSINQIASFDFVDQNFRIFESRDNPMPREAHASCLYADNFIVTVGGQVMKSNKVLDQHKPLPFNVVDIRNGTSIDIPLSFVKGWELFRARKDHTMIAFREELYVFGGQLLQKKSKNSDEEILSDLLKIKMDVCEGNQNLGNLLTNVGFVALNEHYLVRLSVEKVNYEGHRLALHSHSCSVLNNELFILAGGETYNSSNGKDPLMYNASVFAYNVAKNFMFEIKSLSRVIPNRMSHSASVWQNTIIIYGGVDEDREFLGDMVQLKFTPHKIEEEPTNHSKDVCKICKNSLEETKRKILYAINCKTQEGSNTYAGNLFNQTSTKNSMVVEDPTPADNYLKIDPFASNGKSLNPQDSLSKPIPNQVQKTSSITSQVKSLTNKAELLTYSVSDEVAAVLNILNFFKGHSIDILFTNCEISFEINLKHSTPQFKLQSFFRDQDSLSPTQLQRQFLIASVFFLGDKADMRMEDLAIDLNTGEVSQMPDKFTSLFFIARRLPENPFSVITLEILHFIMQHFYLADTNVGDFTLNTSLIDFSFYGNFFELAHFNDDHFDRYYCERVSERSFVLVYRDNALVKFYLLERNTFVLLSLKNHEGDALGQQFSNRLEIKLLNMMMQLNPIQ
jgi:hypothetical protein